MYSEIFDIKMTIVIPGNKRHGMILSRRSFKRSTFRWLYIFKKIYVLFARRTTVAVKFLFL